MRHAVALSLVLMLAVAGCRGSHEGAGTPTGKAVPEKVVAARAAEQKQALAGLGARDGAAKQILFGDLHVHTTFSVDAFMRTLPLMQGEGAHPPADDTVYILTPRRQHQHRQTRLGA
jgi:hypothetical protein